MTSYPHLFSEWKIRNATIPNRIAFAPTCPTWVANPYEGRFTDQAAAYYEERAKGGCGLILIGGTVIDRNALYSPFLFPGLWEDEQIEGFAKVADVVHAHGAKVATQLLHVGSRASSVLKTEPGYDLDATWYMVAPSQVPPGEYPSAPMPKELEDEEIEELLDAYASAARRAIEAGLDGVEVHMAHGYLPWQFLSPLYNHRTDRWGGSYENRLRFPVEAMKRVRKAIGNDAFLGYRINSTSFWDGDLELDDVKSIVADFEAHVDLDYVNLSAGVHHSYIHTPMTYAGGWEREYTRGVKEVTEKPVLLVGRVTTPEVAEELLAAGDADAILMARQMFTDPEWGLKAREGRPEDIRRCVAANYCWRSAIRGGRVQCVYNPTVGREAEWGAGTLKKVASPRRILIVGGGPAGLEYARVSAARGHDVVVYEREPDLGGHVRVHALLPGRANYGEITRWLGDQARKNGAVIKLDSEIAADNLDGVIRAEAPDHIVVATGSEWRRDGFQGFTGTGLPGWESGNCATWDEVITGKVTAPEGDVVVLDDVCNANAPLTAVAIAEGPGFPNVTLVTRWPSVGLETMPEVYHHWIMHALYEREIGLIADHFVRKIDGDRVTIYNLYAKEDERELKADLIVMATGRQSRNSLYAILKERGEHVEVIGDATAPRGTYEAVFEGHRQARKV